MYLIFWGETLVSNQKSRKYPTSRIHQEPSDSAAKKKIKHKTRLFTTRCQLQHHDMFLQTSKADSHKQLAASTQQQSSSPLWNAVSMGWLVCFMIFLYIFWFSGILVIPLSVSPMWKITSMTATKTLSTNPLMWWLFPTWHVKTWQKQCSGFTHLNRYSTNYYTLMV